RVFKPVILFHDHSYSTDPSGVTHRIHIPYGDPHYTPLIQQKKHKVGLMLQTNGRAWYDIIRSSRSRYKTPKPSSYTTKKRHYYQADSSSAASNTMIARKRRGNLPKAVTAVLKQWLVDHCRNPYPTEVEKTGLKDKTGLTLNQISNWFINARRRLLPQILATMHPNH
ncbi:homeobox KN domain-containing protein, partial [Mucor lusitanicus]